MVPMSDYDSRADTSFRLSARTPRLHMTNQFFDAPILNSPYEYQHGNGYSTTTANLRIPSSTTKRVSAAGAEIRLQCLDVDDHRHAMPFGVVRLLHLGTQLKRLSA